MKRKIPFRKGKIDPYKLEIINQDERIIKAWATVEVKDRQGDIIPIEEVAKIMPIIMDRGGLIMYKHSNKPVGKILGWEIREHPETGKPGLLLTIKIFKHYSIDDEVWEKIKKGIIKGISFGGIAKNIEWKKDDKGNQVRVLRSIEGLEFSLVEEPANQYATIVAINEYAKSFIKERYPSIFNTIAIELYGKKFSELSEEDKKKVLNEVEKYIEEWIEYLYKKIEEEDVEKQVKEKILKSIKNFKKSKSRYIDENGRFKVMTCPDDPSKKSRFCGCVRYFMSEEGLSLEEAKRMCGYIRYYVKKGYNINNIYHILKQLEDEDVMRLRDILAQAIYNKKFEELNEEEKQKVHEVAILVKQKIIRSLFSKRRLELLKNRILNKLSVLLYDVYFNELYKDYKNIVLKIYDTVIKKYIEFKKPEDLRPPKEWFMRVVRRLKEEGYSEDAARRIAGWLYYYRLKPKPKEDDKPSTRMARERKQEYLEENKEITKDQLEDSLYAKIRRLNNKLKDFDDFLAKLAIEIEDLYLKAEDNEDDRAKWLKRIYDKLTKARSKVKEELREVIDLT